MPMELNKSRSNTATLRNPEFLFAIALAFISPIATTSHAQTKSAQVASDYPVKPIRIIVGNAPGGGTDMVARLIAQKLGEQWNRSLVVDNRAGGTGIIAMQITAQAPADGYTL